MNHLSLFTGIGGLDLAAEWAGFKSVGQVEIDDYCNKVLEKHWPDVPRWRDIFELKGEEIEEKCGSISLLSGGFPCQPFSCAGKRKGIEDERYLWGEMLRVICEVRPRWVVAENVRGLLSIDAGRTFGTVLSDLAENGYRVGWLCYGAGDIGAPHRRERVFIVANSQLHGQFTGEVGGSITPSSDNNTEGQDNPCKFKGTGRPRSGESLPGSEMGDTNRQRMEGCEDTGEVSREGQEREQHLIRQSEGKADRATQSTMGRVPTRFPAGMDGNYWPAGQWPTPRSCEAEGGLVNNAKFEDGRWFRENKKGVKWGIKLKDAVAGAELWPAGPGEQHEWEPPRIATGIKDRVSRLKALGNSVVPQQAYPIFKAIAEIEEG